jgi:hypothetical protein
MTKPMIIHQLTIALDQYLKSNDNFEGDDGKNVTSTVLATWATKFISAIVADISSRFDKVEIEVVASEFDLSSEDNQGACLFLQHVVISDKMNGESLRVFVKTLVNYTKTTVYLDSSYATVDKWPGKSKLLRSIFERLKTADKKLGYFNPISLAELLK